MDSVTPVQGTGDNDAHANEARVHAWDMPTRLFHWTLVLLFANAWATATHLYKIGIDQLLLHTVNGYAILTLLVFRLLWGLWGSSTSRFAMFVRGPRYALAYVRAGLAGHSHRYIGHNPLGALMVLALLTGVIVQAVFGLGTYVEDDQAAGPLARLVPDAWVDWVAFIHERGFYVILGLVGLHVATNFIYGVVKREPLIAAMVTGRKPRADYVDAHGAVIAPKVALRASATLILAAALVFGGVYLAAGKLLP